MIIDYRPSRAQNVPFLKSANGYCRFFDADTGKELLHVFHHDTETGEVAYLDHDAAGMLVKVEGENVVMRSRHRVRVTSKDGKVEWFPADDPNVPE